MVKKPRNLAKARATYALSKLSKALCSDVLSDGTIAQRFQIPVGHPLHLIEGVVVSRVALFAAFRQVLSGQDVPSIPDENGKRVAVTISIDSEGNGLLDFSDRKVRFENVGLLAEDDHKRLECLNQVLTRHTLSRQTVEKLRTAAAKPLSDADFLECLKTVATSHETLRDVVNPKIEARQIAYSDIIPSQSGYWEQLTATLTDSQSLPDFLNDELGSERAFLVGGEPAQAIRAISLSFCGPELVPIQLFRRLEADYVLSMLQESLKFSDHFGIIGAFEICSDWYPRDTRFASIGSDLLDALFANLDQLKDMCRLFGVGFILATVKLHQHQVLQRRPAFWRRVVAAAHGSLLARIIGPSEIDPTPLLKWAMGIAGKAYYCSISLDSFDEPRWNPDWITPEMLVADVFGRANSAVRTLPEGHLNAQWSETIENAQSKLGRSVVHSTYPAIGESRPRIQPKLEEMGDLLPLYRKFVDNPSLDNFLASEPLFVSFGTPPESLTALLQVVSDLRQIPMKWDDKKVQHAIALAVYVAAQVKDRSLADAIAEHLIESASTIGEERVAGELSFRLLECAAADSDRSNSHRVLANRLEAVAYLLMPNQVPYVHDLLLILAKIDLGLAQLLGKAIATARMASSAR